MAIPRFWLTLGGSLTVHFAVLFVLFQVRTPSGALPTRAEPKVPLTMGIQPVAVEPIGVSVPIADEKPAEASPRQKPMIPLHAKGAAANSYRPSRNSDGESRSPQNISEKPVLSNAETEPNTDESVAISSSQSLKAAMLDATKHNAIPLVGAGFGSMEMLLKERRLERALTWVFPKVISNDRSYWQLPIGKLGLIRFTLSLDRDGKIVGTRFVDANPEVRLQALVRRMTQFLRPGRFSGGGQALEETVERRFVLSVTYRRSPTSVDAEPGEIERIGFDAPEAGRPGRGYVVDRTGRELTAELKELPALSAAAPLPSEVPAPSIVPEP